MPDRTCVYCGKRLTFFLKFSGDGKFCSSAHRKAYQEEMERLALESLSRSERASRRQLTEPRPAPPEPEAALPTPAAQPEPEPDFLVPDPAEALLQPLAPRLPATTRSKTFGAAIRLGISVPECSTVAVGLTALGAAGRLPVPVQPAQPARLTRLSVSAPAPRPLAMRYPVAARPLLLSRHVNGAGRVSLAVLAAAPRWTSVTSPARRLRKTAGSFAAPALIASEVPLISGKSPAWAMAVRIPMPPRNGNPAPSLQPVPAMGVPPDTMRPATTWRVPVFGHAGRTALPVPPQRVWETGCTAAGGPVPILDARPVACPCVPNHRAPAPDGSLCSAPLVRLTAPATVGGEPTGNFPVAQPLGRRFQLLASAVNRTASDSPAEGKSSRPHDSEPPLAGRVPIPLRSCLPAAQACAVNAPCPLPPGVEIPCAHRFDASAIPAGAMRGCSAPVRKSFNVAAPTLPAAVIACLPVTGRSPVRRPEARLSPSSSHVRVQATPGLEPPEMAGPVRFRLQRRNTSAPVADPGSRLLAALPQPAVPSQLLAAAVARATGGRAHGPAASSAIDLLALSRAGAKAPQPVGIRQDSLAGAALPAPAVTAPTEPRATRGTGLPPGSGVMVPKGPGRDLPGVPPCQAADLEPVERMPAAVLASTALTPGEPALETASELLAVERPRRRASFAARPEAAPLQAVQPLSAPAIVSVADRLVEPGVHPGSSLPHLRAFNAVKSAARRVPRPEAIDARPTLAIGSAARATAGPVRRAISAPTAELVRNRPLAPSPDAASARPLPRAIQQKWAPIFALPAISQITGQPIPASELLYLGQLRARTARHYLSPDLTPAAAQPVAARPLSPGARPCAGLDTALAVEIVVGVQEPNNAPSIFAFELPFAATLFRADHHPAPRRKQLPALGAPRMISTPLEVAGGFEQSLRWPSPTATLDLEATSPVGSPADSAASQPRPIGAARAIEFDCGVWPESGTGLPFRRNEPNDGGVYVPQIRTNTLRPAILFLPGPPGATPADETSPGRSSVISIADLRGGTAPIKERARSGGRRW